MWQAHTHILMTTHSRATPRHSGQRKSQHASRTGDHLAAFAIVYRNGQANAHINQSDFDAALHDPQALTWIDLSEENIDKFIGILAHTLEIDRFTIEMVSELRERAKFTESKGYYYLVVHDLSYDSEEQTANLHKLDIIFGPNFLVTIHREPMPWLDQLQQATIRPNVDDMIMGRGIGFLLHQILDSLTDGYFPVLDQIDDEIDELEDITVSQPDDAVQARIFRTKRALALIRRVISPQIEVTNVLTTRTNGLIPAELMPQFADVHDHLVRAFETIDSYRDLMSGLLDVYLSTVSNRLNVVMKQLAIIATIFMPITFLTGIFGMNFGHSPQVEHDNGSLFWISLLVMALITGMQIWYFRRRGWL
jgi:magnesium transporter